MNRYHRLRNYFIPNAQKSNVSTHLLLLLDFYILTAIFAIFFTFFYALIECKEAAIAVGLMFFLYVLGLVLIKKGISLWFLSHYNLFLGGFLGVLIPTFFSGGLQSPVIPWLVLLPVSALLEFDDMKNVIIWIVAPVLIFLSFFLASYMGFSAPIHYNLAWKNFLYNVSYSGLTLIIFLVSHVFKSFINNNLKQLKAAQAQLIQSEKLASLGELTAGIAHEIQNPLNFVNNFSELSVDLVKDLKDELKRPDKDENYIAELFDDLSQNQEKISYHGKRASNIVKGMLEHSNSDIGERQLTDINALCEEYLRLAFHGMRAKDKSFNADFKTNFDPNLPNINIVPQDIGRVLLNLINNAFYAVHQKSKSATNYTPSVFLTTERFENQIIIKVKDNGNGIPQDIISKIFQPFFTTKPTGEGTGLGLSLAYDIITKGHGGILAVETVPNQHTIFSIKLPLN